MILIAHRAGTDRYPEQSLDSASFSLSEGADFVELDVRYTQDKSIPVICHDANALRVFGIDKEIEMMSLPEFLGLRHLSSPSTGVYTLEDLLREDMHPLLLHIKSSLDLYGPILDLIHKYSVEDEVVLGVQEINGVYAVKDDDEAIRVLSFMHAESDFDEYLDSPCEYIRLWENWVVQEKIDKAHSFGKKVWVMSGTAKTVGRTEWCNLKKWESMGVDGVLIDEFLKARKFIGDDNGR